MAPRSEFKECLTSAWNSIFIPLVQELWPSLTFTLSHKSAMKPRDLGFFSCFPTLVLHLEPRGGRSLPPSLGRRRVPTGTTTSGHAQLREQLSHALAEAGQVGRGRDGGLWEKACGQDEKPANSPVSRNTLWLKFALRLTVPRVVASEFGELTPQDTCQAS